MRNKVFAPLFGNAEPEEANTPASPTQVPPTQSVASSPQIKLPVIDDSKKRLIWLAFLIILFLVLIYLLYSPKSKPKRKNPKRLISRFKNASKRESLEE